MNTIQDYLTTDHRRCDDIFSALEELVDRGDWERAASTTESFFRSMEAHFAMEEQVLFPAFEAASGMTGGPTMVMRSEHAQMRELFTELNDALENQDADTYLGLTETLLVMMQQHNMKEENMLYPMTDQFLPEQEVERVLEQMETLRQGE